MNSSQEIQSINNQRTSTGAVSEIQNHHNKTSEALKYTIETRVVENESLTDQNSGLTYTQEEVDALGFESNRLVKATEKE